MPDGILWGHGLTQAAPHTPPPPDPGIALLTGISIAT